MAKKTPAKLSSPVARKKGGGKPSKAASAKKPPAKTSAPAKTTAKLKKTAAPASPAQKGKAQSIGKGVAAKAAKPAVAQKPVAKPAAKVAVAKPPAKPAAKAPQAPARPGPTPVTTSALANGRPSQVRPMPAPVAGRAEVKAAPAMPQPKQAVSPAQASATLGPKKPVSQRHGFKMNEFIIYPTHGIGRIVGIEEQEIAGISLELFVIEFEKDKMTLRVPTAKLQAVGMRKLSEDGIVKRAMETLKGRARIKRTMWSRRAQEYDAKINSGDLVAIAEVVRDLYRAENQPEQSYSERQLYEAALDRMAREIAAIERIDERSAVQRVTEVLARSAKSRRTAEEEAAAAQAQGAIKAA